jgi:ribonucleoside-diphosphate reductase subunit M1
MKADIEEGDSPKVLPTEPSEGVVDEELAEPGAKPAGQSEDGDDSGDRERDIYSEAVLACE